MLYIPNAPLFVIRGWRANDGSEVIEVQTDWFVIEVRDNGYEITVIVTASQSFPNPTQVTESVSNAEFLAGERLTLDEIAAYRLGYTAPTRLSAEYLRAQPAAYDTPSFNVVVSHRLGRININISDAAAMVTPRDCVDRDMNCLIIFLNVDGSEVGNFAPI